MIRLNPSVILLTRNDVVSSLVETTSTPSPSTSSEPALSSSQKLPVHIEGSPTLGRSLHNSYLSSTSPITLPIPAVGMSPRRNYVSRPAMSPSSFIPGSAPRSMMTMAEMDTLQYLSSTRIFERPAVDDSLQSTMQRAMGMGGDMPQAGGSPEVCYYRSGARSTALPTTFLTNSRTRTTSGMLPGPNPSLYDSSHHGSGVPGRAIRSGYYPAPLANTNRSSQTAYPNSSSSESSDNQINIYDENEMESDDMTPSQYHFHVPRSRQRNMPQVRQNAIPNISISSADDDHMMRNMPDSSPPMVAGPSMPVRRSARLHPSSPLVTQLPSLPPVLSSEDMERHVHGNNPTNNSGSRHTNSRGRGRRRSLEQSGSVRRYRVD